MVLAKYPWDHESCRGLQLSPGGSGAGEKAPKQYSHTVPQTPLSSVPAGALSCCPWHATEFYIKRLSSTESWTPLNSWTGKRPFMKLNNWGRGSLGGGKNNKNYYLFFLEKLILASTKTSGQLDIQQAGILLWFRSKGIRGKAIRNLCRGGEGDTAPAWSYRTT